MPSLQLSLRQTLALRQTYTLRLDQDQMEKLSVYEKILKRKIHGPDLSVDKIFIDDEPALRFSEAQNSESWGRVPMLPKNKLDEAIKNLGSGLTPVSLYCRNVTLYVNILFYYETLNSAYEANGKLYNNPALENWQTNIVEFLGILSDNQIGKIVGKASGSIGYYRRRLGIPNVVENFSETAVNKENVFRVQAANLDSLRASQSSFVDKTFSCATKEFIKNFLAKSEKKSDYKLCKDLQFAGVNIARRTVNKYRREVLRERGLNS